MQFSTSKKIIQLNIYLMKQNSQRSENNQMVWLANSWVSARKGKLPFSTPCRHIGGVVA
jgi:hypothetical protein